ncbi:RNA polymerase sigma-70 factor (ECF subfamily) [Chromohalobacter marismortui]|uniref:RNA polymerase sigma-70 factor (ECF subfamily) n=1 Tax=Chromohalobacter marismortui TaxID=42055 RepID=A0A4R7NN92_9GAMM|nr:MULTISPECIES: sigma-70 family RNA polymerase sigma factor [Chromohalobacter]MCI0509573.1 sigma-70 family RNA polymerase sigma factor [Chromohalobacter sp.]MCI0592533.1 sigma-70 family RNA polymerase sigma factor [Chromohalobacter sp.]TDU22293.1 RNA polymerase sigma-70 factor (ECF subfamily) [Chromohalobacter marismortui]
MSASPDSAHDADSLDARQRRLAAVRPRLLAFARLQLRDASEADDVVQEALITAVEKDAHFAGKSGYETWVFGILKNKILDALRAQKRRGKWQSWEDDGVEAAVENQFQATGRWQDMARPRSWGDPESTLASERFWQVFDSCMIALPENIARIFTMRELMGLSTRQICEEAGIKENNCWVILHRGRLLLRACLEKGWLTEADS